MTTYANQQKAIKASSNAGVGQIVVHSIWQTIQGEGPLVGRAAVFVRLYGCNLQCPACDTDYTSNQHVMSFEEIENVIFSYETKLVVISGGEPFRHETLPEFIAYLLRAGYTVQVETNGTIYRHLPSDTWITISPKSKVDPRWYNLSPRNHRVYWKYVVECGEIEMDGLPSKALGGARPDRPSAGVPNHHIYIQPLDEKDEQRNKDNAELAARLCMENDWVLSMQVHKLISTIE